MGTITNDAPGFTEKAQKLAEEAVRFSVDGLCEALMGDQNMVLDLADSKGLTEDEIRVGLRSALAARLMREGVLNITGGR